MKMASNLTGDSRKLYVKDPTKSFEKRPPSKQHVSLSLTFGLLRSVATKDIEKLQTDGATSMREWTDDRSTLCLFILYRFCFSWVNLLIKSFQMDRSLQKSKKRSLSLLLPNKTDHFSIVNSEVTPVYRHGDSQHSLMMSLWTKFPSNWILVEKDFLLTDRLLFYRSQNYLLSVYMIESWFNTFIISIQQIAAKLIIWYVDQ